MRKGTVTMPKKPIRALITGGAGFIGSHLSEELLSRNFHVTVVDNLATGISSNLGHVLRNKRFKFYKGSVFNKKLMSRLIKQCDIIYHFAAAVGVKYILDHALECILTSIQGTNIVLQLAAKYRKKVLIASSSEVSGKLHARLMKEEDDRVLGPTTVNRWIYSEGKALGEYLAFAYHKQFKLRMVIVRFFNILGPRQISDYGMVLPRFIEEAMTGRPITIMGNGSQVRSFTYVLDAVRAVADLSLTKEAEGRIFNIGNNQSQVTIKQLAHLVKRKTKSKSKIVYLSYDKYYGKQFEDVARRVPDISRIKKVIGYRPRYGLAQIIDETLAYFRENNAKKA